ncbi:hypothetical protein B0H10DRAFT_2230189 [Mycena sp. CBHHK59/15]|nr:hypothetical protein B0H10DRAFT_2230189 [Mycena sp. CBHHK59/15]
MAARGRRPQPESAGGVKGHLKTHGAREEVMQELGLPPSQVLIWKINCWSVHKSKEFLVWMKHPNIIVLFVPGGCTGIWQPLDIDHAGKATHEIRLNTTMPTLRNWSVGWIVQAIQDIGDSTTITRAFEMCRIDDDHASVHTFPTPHAPSMLADSDDDNDLNSEIVPPELDELCAPEAGDFGGDGYPHPAPPKTFLERMAALGTKQFLTVAPDISLAKAALTDIELVL